MATTELTHPAIDELKKELAEVEESVLTNCHLADAIRLGSSKTNKAEAWRVGDNVCSLSAGFIGAKALGWL